MWASPCTQLLGPAGNTHQGMNSLRFSQSQATSAKCPKIKGMSFTALSWQGSVNDFLSDLLFPVTVLWMFLPTFSPSEGRWKPINMSSEDSCFQEHWFCLPAPSPFPLSLCYSIFKRHWTRTLSVAYCPPFTAVFSEVVWPTHHRTGGRAVPAFLSLLQLIVKWHEPE